MHNRQGVLVATVFPNTLAAAAGLKAADVIQKVNGQPIVQVSDWEKAIRANRGKQVQVTIIRDKKEQTVTMVAGEGKNSGELDYDLPDAQTLADLRGEIAGLNTDVLSQEIQESMKSLDSQALQQEAEKMARSFDSEKFQQELRKQMDELRNSLQSMQLEQMD